MPKTSTPHLNRETRNGVTRYYFRKGNDSRIRICQEYGTVKFWEEYKALLDGRAIEINAAKNPNIVKARFPRRITNVLVQCQQRAIGLRREFDLTEDWLIGEFERQDYRCALTGIPFQAGRTGGSRINPYAPSLDRIDCARGYTKDNVRVILASVNVALNNFGLAHFDYLAAARMQQIVKERHAT
jgi:hypothetical protein